MVQRLTGVTDAAIQHIVLGVVQPAVDLHVFAVRDGIADGTGMVLVHLAEEAFGTFAGDVVLHKGVARLLYFVTARPCADYFALPRKYQAIFAHRPQAKGWWEDIP